ncbi:unnamed protein product [Tilletia controversa]|nr:unnamed protein product [Tilletia controversa]
MSSRKRDLIERVKYPNPLPLPPYPPKLLNIPLAPERYANPAFGHRLASELPIPLLADAEAGIHIDLPGTFPGIWLNDPSTYTLPSSSTSTSTAAPPEINLGEIDQTDAFLLQDFSLSLQQQSSAPATALPPSLDAGALKGAAGAGSSAATAAAVAHHIQSQHNAALGPLARSSLGANDVTWLRRTEYLSAEAKRQRAQEIKQRVQEHVDISREAQIKAIAQTFKAVHSAPGGNNSTQTAPITALRHPTKPGVHAVEAFDVLPDPETWATEFQIVRFLDWPGRTSKGGGGAPIDDPRLDVHLLRPHGEANQIISVYMPSGEFMEGEEVLEGMPSTEEIEEEYEAAKKAAEELPEEPAPPAEGEEDAVGVGRQEALDAAEATYKAKLALHTYVTNTRSTITPLSSKERENLAAARFAKRRRTGVFPVDDMPSAPIPEEGEEEEAEVAVDHLKRASKAAATTKFVHVRDYEPSAELGAATSAGQLVFVFDSGPDGGEDGKGKEKEMLDRIEAPLEVHGLADDFPTSSRAKYSSLDIVETDPLTGGAQSAEGKDAASGSGSGSSSAPPQSSLERAYRAKLIESVKEEEGRDQREVVRRAGLKAAYYHPVHMNFKLRMKRYKKSEKPADQEDFWDVVEIAQKHLSPSEVYERLAARRDVDDLDRLVLQLEEEVEEEGMAVDEDAEGEDVDVDAMGEVDAEGEVDGEGQGENEAEAEGEATATKTAENADDEEEEEEEGGEGEANGDAEGGGGDDDDDDEDEEGEGDDDAEDMDDEELAALRADAAENGEQVGGGEGEGEGRSRRSRRGGAD